MKRNLYKIDIRVHPLVWRYIDNNFQTIRGAYDITSSSYYPIVSSMLCQSNVRLPSKVRPTFEAFRPISVYITEYDFYHYGFSVCELQQLRFSKLMRSLVIDSICRRIAMLRAAYDVPLTRAVCLMIDANLFEDNELKTDTLRKIYQRHYKETEKEYAEQFSDCVTEYGTNDDGFKKKMCNLSQTYKQHLKTWKI